MSTVHLLSLSDWYWYHVVFEGVFLIVHLCALCWWFKEINLYKTIKYCSQPACVDPYITLKAPKTLSHPCLNSFPRSPQCLFLLFPSIDVIWSYHLDGHLLKATYSHYGNKWGHNQVKHFAKHVSSHTCTHTPTHAHTSINTHII